MYFNEIKINIEKIKPFCLDIKIQPLRGKRIYND